MSRGRARNRSHRAGKALSAGACVRIVPYGAAMTERQSSEVEKVLLHLSDARTRARRAAELVEKDGAKPHVVEALRATERELANLHRALSQGTYYAVTDSSLQLAV